MVATLGRRRKVSSTSSPTVSSDRRVNRGAALSFSTPKACDRGERRRRRSAGRTEPGEAVDQAGRQQRRRRGPPPPSTSTRVRPRLPELGKAPTARSISTVSVAGTSISSTPQSREGLAARGIDAVRDGRSRSAPFCASATSFAVSGMRRLPSTTIRTGLRSSRPGKPAGQLRIVGDHRADADHHRVMRRAQQMRAVARRLAGDPSAFADASRDPAVERGGELQRDQRPAVADAHEETGIELARRFARRARSRPRCRRRASAASPRPETRGSGSSIATTTRAIAGGDQRIGARRRLAVMAHGSRLI